MQKLEEQGYFLPVVDVGCRYKSPAFFNDKLQITCDFYQDKLKYNFEYSIFRSGSLISKGYSVHTVTGRNKKIINLEKENPRLYAKLKAMSTKEE